MKLSCAQDMVPGRNLTEKADRAREWGFSGLTLIVDYSQHSDMFAYELLDLKKQTGVEVCEFIYTGDQFGQHMNDDKRIRERAMEIFHASLDLCGEIGALTGIGYEYKAQDPLPLFIIHPQLPPDKERKIVEVLAELGEYATQKNAVLTLEPINRYESKYLNTLEQCRGVIDKAGKPKMLGIVADFFHLAMEEDSIPDAIRASKGYIRHVHLGENNRRLPGYGTTDWTAGFRALKDIGYNKYLALECAVAGDPEVMLPACVKFLREKWDQA